MQPLAQNEEWLSADQPLARAALDGLLKSRRLSARAALCDLLALLVKHSAEAEPLTQTILSLELYRSTDREKTVRSYAWRLREQLAEYYAKEGADEPVEVRLNMGPGYQLRFAKRRRPTQYQLPGRGEQLRRVQQAIDQAAKAHGGTLCIAGESGLGKTALVDAAISNEFKTGRVWHIARGGCSERLVATSAYLPVVEALDTLTRGTGGESLIGELRTLAPTWYIQLDLAQASHDLHNQRLSIDTRAASSDRLKREFLGFLTAVAERTPVLLFLDDIHWADTSTIDLLSHLCNRISDSRVLVLLAYRRSVLARTAHSFLRINAELKLKHLSQELRLDLLNEADVRNIVSMKFPGNTFPADFAELLYECTEGNPLFVVDILRYLRDEGIIAPREHNWALVQGVDKLGPGLPESVAALIDCKVSQLNQADLSLLLAASVQGPGFDSAILAEVLHADALQVEAQLRRLEDHHAIIKAIGERELPDEPSNLRYQFVHVLYQQELYARLGPTRRAALSRATAEALLKHHQQTVSSVAATAAVLFETAREHLRAAHYMLVAAQGTMRISPNRTTIDQAQRGLTLLSKVKAGPEKTQIEFALQSTLAACFMSLEGYSSVNASEAYHRAYNLGMESGQTSCLITPLWGLWAFHITRGDPSPARAYAAQTQKIADAVGDPALLVEACYATGITALHGGELEAAKAHFSRGLTIYESATNKIEFLLYLFDPGVACRLHLARTLWQMGFPDTALDQAQRALRRAESLGHPQTIAYALVFTSLVHLLRREAFPGEQYALAAITLSDTHGFPQERVWATGLYGWSLALRERASEGVDLIVGVCKIQEQNGSRIAGTQFAAILAEALSLAGDFSSAIQVLDEGLAQAEQILEHYYQAELYRLKGEYLGKVTRGEGDLVKADECLTLAATLARQQGARLLELRALRSKAQLWIDNGNKHALNVADDLRALYSRFTEGHQTLDLAESYAVIRRFVAFGATPRTIGDSCEHEGS